MTVYNFCAGPATLPKEVMQKAQSELINWQDTGCSVMEMSHRSKEFIAVYENAVAALKKLMDIPDNYSVLFMQGGGRGQFAAVPMNLNQGNTANYVTTGQWSSDAVDEASKFMTANEQVCRVVKNGLSSVLPFDKWTVDESADFIHFCSNETVDGIEIFESPKALKVTRNVPVVCDMSSNILSRNINVTDYDIIYAGAQKNIGPSGLSIVIINNALLKRSPNNIPSLLNYRVTQEKESMFNTPPTFAIYLSKLVFEWLLENGGVDAIEKVNKEKAALLYKAIDESNLYENRVAKENRSLMNVTFYLKDESLNDEFLAAAKERGLVALKGHRSVGGMRASIYNAMPIEGVQALTEFMKEFELQQEGKK